MFSLSMQKLGKVAAVSREKGKQPGLPEDKSRKGVLRIRALSTKVPNQPYT